MIRVEGEEPLNDLGAPPTASSPLQPSPRPSAALLPPRSSPSSLTTRNPQVEPTSLSFRPRLTARGMLCFAAGVGESLRSAADPLGASTRRHRPSTDRKLEGFLRLIRKP